MPQALNTFDHDATVAIVRMLRDEQAELQGKPTGGKDNPRDVLRMRIAKVPSGSDPTTKKFQAIFGDATWTEAEGDEDIQFTPYEPEADNKHWIYNDGPPPKANDLVLVALTMGRWYMLPTSGDWEEGKVEKQPGINRGESGNVRVYRNGSSTSRVENCLLPWLATTRIDYGKEVMIQWDRYRKRWCIRLAQC